ncbi:MAG: hypothetical protein ACRDVM_01390 [Acidimicrobiia bacterium]
MRRIYRALPGPAPVRVLLLAVLVVIALAVLVVVFERAGDLLDTGGTVGPPGP